MILPIVNYGHPVLRKRGAPIEEITPEILQLIDDMIETMDDADGVGLAAQQIGKALQLTVVDVLPATDRPSSMKINGEEVNLEDYMPMALINPELKPFGDRVDGPEGCLSIPKVYDDINRPECVEVKAMTPEGGTIEFTCDGLLSRAVQHEADHLNGILFIDRMSRDVKARHQEALDELQAETKKALKNS